MSNYHQNRVAKLVEYISGYVFEGGASRGIVFISAHWVFFQQLVQIQTEKCVTINV